MKTIIISLLFTCLSYGQVIKEVCGSEVTFAKTKNEKEITIFKDGTQVFKTILNAEKLDLNLPKGTYTMFIRIWVNRLDCIVENKEIKI
mgnify:FL=1